MSAFNVSIFHRILSQKIGGNIKPCLGHDVTNIQLCCIVKQCIPTT